MKKGKNMFYFYQYWEGDNDNMAVQALFSLFFL